MPQTVPQEAIYIGQIVPRTDLGIDFREPVDIHYLDQPLQVFRTDEEKHQSTRYDVVSEHASLHGTNLVKFLGTIARQTYQQDLGGVIADWDVVERSAEAGADYARYLVELHTHMGKPWVDFMQSRPSFLAVAEDDKVPREFSDKKYLVYNGEILRGRDLTTEKVLADQGISVDMEIFEQLIGCIEAEGIEGTRQMVSDAIEKEVNRKRNPTLSNPLAIAREFANGAEKRRKKVLGQILSWLETDVRTAVGENLFGKIYSEVCHDAGTVFYVRSDRLDRKMPTKIHTEKSANHKAEFVTVHLRGGKARSFIKPSSIQKVGGLSLEPALSWTVADNGHRSFNVNRQIHEHGDEKVFADGVLGILLAAYMLPEVRERWPKEMGIRGGRKQIINAAQVPVLALMRQGELLKSDFIKSVEEFAGSTQVSTRQTNC